MAQPFPNQDAPKWLRSCARFRGWMLQSFPNDCFGHWLMSCAPQAATNGSSAKQSDICSSAHCFLTCMGTLLIARHGSPFDRSCHFQFCFSSISKMRGDDLPELISAPRVTCAAAFLRTLRSTELFNTS